MTTKRRRRLLPLVATLAFRESRSEKRTLAKCLKMRLALCVFLLAMAGSTLAKQKGSYWWLFPKFDEHSPDNQKESSNLAAVAAEMGGDDRNESIYSGLNNDTDGSEADLEYEDTMDQQTGDASDDEAKELNPNDANKDEANLAKEMRSQSEEDETEALEAEQEPGNKEDEDVLLMGKDIETESESKSKDDATPLEIVEDELIIDDEEATDSEEKMKEDPVEAPQDDESQLPETDESEKNTGKEKEEDINAEKEDSSEEKREEKESKTLEVEDINAEKEDSSEEKKEDANAEKEKKDSSEEDSSEEKKGEKESKTLEVEDGSGSDSSEESETDQEKDETAPEEPDQEEERRVAIELASVRQMLKNEQDQDPLTVDEDAESKGEGEEVDDDQDQEEEEDYDVLVNGVDSEKDKELINIIVDEIKEESTAPKKLEVRESLRSTTIPIILIVISFKLDVPVCSFNSTPFTLEIEPKSVNEDTGSDALLVCKLIPKNSTVVPMPPFKISWIFQKNYCPKGICLLKCCLLIWANLNCMRNEKMRARMNALQSFDRQRSKQTRRFIS